MRARRPLRSVAALSAWALGACTEPISTPPAGDDLTAIAADNVQYDMRSIFTAEGVRTGVVDADSAFIYADSADAHMYGVNITFENERGLELARVVADSGRLNQRTERMQAWGSVVVELPERGCRILTEEIRYDPPAQQIHTDKAVRFEQSGMVATGAGFTSDLQMTEFTILQPSGPFFNMCSASELGLGLEP
jgi:LPS export ABC transporter protein LptC